MNYQVKNVYKKTINSPVTHKVPGSKSITARALLIAALAKGESKLFGAQLSEDCLNFLNCLKNLGIKIEVYGDTVTVEGCNGVIPKKSANIYVGSAGTAARFLPVLLAFSKGEYFVDASPQMKARPIEPLITSLKNMGAKFEFSEKENSFPFKIYSASSPKLSVSVDITKSSQYLSAYLLSAVCAKKPFRIKAEGSHGLSYVNMTLDMAWSFGVDIKEKDGEYEVFGEYIAKRYDIEPDVSSACYFYAMNKILGTDVRVPGVLNHSLQGDIKFINLLKTFNGGKVDMREFSDQTLTLAAISPYLEKPTEICGVEHIRAQECDRIAAITHNIRAMGGICEERKDGVTIYPFSPKPTHINTFKDHRVAMSFALTGLRADGIVIDNAEVCAKTYKNFFEDLTVLCEKLLK